MGRVIGPYQLLLPGPTPTLGLFMGNSKHKPETWVQAWGGGASPQLQLHFRATETPGCPPNLLRVRPRGAQTCHLHWSPTTVSPTMAPPGSEATPGQGGPSQAASWLRDHWLAPSNQKSHPGDPRNRETSGLLFRLLELGGLLHSKSSQTHTSKRSVNSPSLYFPMKPSQTNLCLSYLFKNAQFSF